MNLTQFIGAPVYFYDKEWYYSWMAVTKQHFGLLIVTMQQWWSPTKVIVSGDKSVAGQLTQSADGCLECDFPERMVLISNHEVRNIEQHWMTMCRLTETIALCRLASSVVDSIHRAYAWPHLHHSQRVAQIRAYSWLGNAVFLLRFPLSELGKGQRTICPSIEQAEEEAEDGGRI